MITTLAAAALGMAVGAAATIVLFAWLSHRSALYLRAVILTMHCPTCGAGDPAIGWLRCPDRFHAI